LRAKYGILIQKQNLSAGLQKHMPASTQTATNHTARPFRSKE